MIRLFLQHSLRYFARHKLLTALNVLGIALGVTVFISVRLVNHSALESFRASIDIVAGKANLEIAGEGVPIDERVYPSVLAHPDVRAATPVVTAIAMLPDHPGEYLSVVGVDIISNAPLRAYELQGDDQEIENGLEFVAEPDALALTATLCQRLGLKLGDSLRLRTRVGTRTFRLTNIIRFIEEIPGADENVALIDIANAQENFGHVGELHRIDCLLRDGADFDKVVAQLQELPLMPAHATVRAPEARSRTVEKMLGAFQINLLALSLVSLLVGMFLIYNTVAAAVVRRRAEIGLLRALGLQRWQVRGLFLAEAGLLGLAGLALGLVLGVLLAQQLLGIVSQNITTLYILVRIQELFISPSAVVAAVVFSLGAVLIAAWFPAAEASEVEPVEALSVGHLREHAQLAAPRWVLIGLGLLALSYLLGWLSMQTGPAWLSFGASLFLLLGFAALLPYLGDLAARGAEALATHFGAVGLTARLAFGQFAQSLHRNAVTVSALMVALAMVVGITVMIHSFRQTVGAWVKKGATGDLYIVPASTQIVGAGETLRPKVLDLVRSLPGVAATDTYREINLTLDGKPFKLGSFDFRVGARYGDLDFRNGRGGTSTERNLTIARAENLVVVSEPFARKFGRQAGDSLTLRTPSGTRQFTIGGVFNDFRSEQGMVLLDRALYQELFADDRVQSMLVHCADGIVPDEMRHDLMPQLAKLGDHIIYSNADLKRRIFEIFDQTFAVTYLLQAIGVIISAFGIFLSLLILIGERTRELGILRAVGALRRQVEATVLWEAALIALLASVLGIAAGLLLAVNMIYVGNIAFFGWTITWSTPWAFLFTLPLAVLAASLLAAWLPARWAARLNIAEAVKSE